MGAAHVSSAVAALLLGAVVLGALSKFSSSSTRSSRYVAADGDPQRFRARHLPADPPFNVLNDTAWFNSAMILRGLAPALRRSQDGGHYPHVAWHGRMSACWLRRAVKSSCGCCYAPGLSRVRGMSLRAASQLRFYSWSWEWSCYRACGGRRWLTGANNHRLRPIAEFQTENALLPPIDRPFPGCSLPELGSATTRVSYRSKSRSTVREVGGV